MIKATRLYFVENGETVKDSNCFLEAKNYKNAISIYQVKKALKPFNLQEKSEFNDMLVYFNESMSITIWLNDENDFYECNKDGNNNLSTYITLVQIIIVDILRKIGRKEMEIISVIMKKFKLSVYNTKNKKHYNNTMEIIKLLVKSNIYKDD